MRVDRIARTEKRVDEMEMRGMAIAFDLSRFHRSFKEQHPVVIADAVGFAALKILLAVRRRVISGPLGLLEAASIVRRPHGVPMAQI